MNLLRRRPVLSALAAGAAGFWMYDKHFTYERAHRSLRAVHAALYTVYQYAYVLDRYPEQLFQIHDRVAQCWYDLCCVNGGLYIKLGQGIATMNHVLPEEYIRLFSNLYDKAPSIPFSEVRRVIREDFGRELEQVFAEFEEEPVASASIAQVHKARLVDGTPVAVKIQKPAIACQMGWDLALYRILLFAFEKTFRLPMYWTADNTCEHLEMEANFFIEALNTVQAKLDLEPNLPDVYVPRIEHSVLSRRVMTMEWIDGVRVSDPEAVIAAGFDVKKVVETMVTAFAQQIFVSGFVHVDPHPGNVLVRKKADGRGHEVVVLDHGLYIKEREQFRVEYCKLWRAMLLMDVPTVRAVCRGWGIEDFELFASAQLFRRFRSDLQAIHVNEINRKEMVALQTEAKERVRKMLEKSAQIPIELVLISRCMNILRSNNKRMGTLVNRIAVMAEKAAEGFHFRPEHRTHTDRFVALRATYDRLNFRFRLWLLSLTFTAMQKWNEAKAWWRGITCDSDETLVDKAIEIASEQLTKGMGAPAAPPAPAAVAR